MTVYFLGFFFFSCICLIPWIIRDSNYSGILESDAINRPWWAFFTTASMYANVGRGSLSQRSHGRIYFDSRWDDFIPTSRLSTVGSICHYDCWVSFGYYTADAVGTLVSPVCSDLLFGYYSNHVEMAQRGKKHTPSFSIILDVASLYYSPAKQHGGFLAFYLSSTVSIYSSFLSLIWVILMSLRSPLVIVSWMDYFKYFLLLCELTNRLFPHERRELQLPIYSSCRQLFWLVILS